MHVKAYTSFMVRYSVAQRGDARTWRASGVINVDIATDASSVPQPLPADQLHRATDLSHLQFSTTADLQPIHGLLGQARALEALRFGTRVEQSGFNFFVIGPNAARMQDFVKAVLLGEARSKPSPRIGFTSTILSIRIGQSPLSFHPAAPGNFKPRCTS